MEYAAQYVIAMIGIVLVFGCILFALFTPFLLLGSTTACLCVGWLTLVAAITIPMSQTKQEATGKLASVVVGIPATIALWFVAKTVLGWFTGI